MAECQKQFPIKSTKTNFESWFEYLETIQKMSVCIFSHINANIYMQQGLQVIKMEHKYLLDVAYMKFIALIL